MKKNKKQEKKEIAKLKKCHGTLKKKEKVVKFYLLQFNKGLNPSIYNCLIQRLLSAN